MSDVTNASQYKPRSALRVTWDVWSAMTLREFIARTTADRMAWFWMIFEPLATIGIMILIRSHLMGSKHISGADFVPWMIIGLMGFYLFRACMMQPMGAISANKGLFTYRQITPFDAVIVRCYVEGMLQSFVFLLFILIGTLFKLNMVAHHAFGVMMDWFSLWALGSGLGILFSVVNSLVPELGKIIRLMTFPLLILSGVILPVSMVPHQLQEYLAWNPILHGLENMRINYFEYYHSIDGIDMTYLWYWALGSMVLGLMMHIRFAPRLKML
ncbi:ABC transporter permease [Salinicola endophyticus]|uniref:Transport permease protein n=1 Tax=Salinicola endophyticus TaxID=1949083 RepID=A0AB74U1T2_9GAMM